MSTVMQQIEDDINETLLKNTVGLKAYQFRSIGKPLIMDVLLKHLKNGNLGNTVNEADLSLFCDLKLGEIEKNLKELLGP